MRGAFFWNNLSILLGLLLVNLPLCASEAASKAPRFSFHLLGEPYTLDPLKAHGSAGSYLYTNLFQGLYKINSESELVPMGAQDCTWKERELWCRLVRNKKWSNGDQVTAQHYLQAFRRLIDPKNKSPQAEALINLKNAEAIFAGKLKPENLGVKAPSRFELVFLFDRQDPEFLYKLSLPALAPVHSLPLPSRENAHLLPVNGPYKIANWEKGQKIVLIPNPKFPDSEHRPEVEIFFIEDDSTALNLYESGRMNFLRRLVSDKIEDYKTRPDFHQFPVARFDYIGFGPKLKDQPELRKALALSLEYSQLRDMYKALGTPGCPSLPSRLQEKVHCHHFDREKAREIFKKTSFKDKRLTLAYSKMGGEDIQRGMEWAQFQWKKNLGLTLELRPQEQGYYLKQLQNHRFDLFRKGVGLDRPTCLAALEIFLPDHPENYLQLKDPEYQTLVQRLSQQSQPQAARKICSQAIELLINKAYLIPLGEIHFTMLARPDFKGWSVNEMNQLDLTHLRHQTHSSQ